MREGLRARHGHKIWLLLGGVLMLFANGRWLVWPAAWLAPVFMIRYFRHAEGRWRPFLWGGAALWVAGLVSWFGLIPFPLPIFFVIATQGAILGLLPFALDRFTHNRRRGLLQTLVFPLSSVSMAFLGSLRSETTWGAVGYTQASVLPLVQLASVTGIWGLTFVVTWFASWANEAWEDWEDGRRLRPLQFAYPVLLVLVLTGGQLRLSFAESAAAPVKVASVTPPDILDHLTPEDLVLFQRFFMKQDVDTDRLHAVRAKLEATYPELFRLTRREARRGAEIVFWPEASVVAFGAARQEELLQQMRALARDEEIYLGASLALVPDSTRELNENKVVLIDPEGQLVGTYYKTRLVPHVEEPFTRGGDGSIGTVDTPYGPLATVICYDLDNPRFIAQLGGRDVALLFAPSGDWPAIKHLHAAMARFRAVELGVSLVRPANHGLTQIVDTRGRAMATMDHYATEDRVLTASVAPGVTETPYARWGDVFAWLCVGAWVPIVLLSSLALRRRQVELGATV